MGVSVLCDAAPSLMIASVLCSAGVALSGDVRGLDCRLSSAHKAGQRHAAQVKHGPMCTP